MNLLDKFNLQIILQTILPPFLSDNAQIFNPLMVSYVLKPLKKHPCFFSKKSVHLEESCTMKVFQNRLVVVPSEANGEHGVPPDEKRGEWRTPSLSKKIHQNTLKMFSS